MGQGKSINSPQRRGWLLGIASILLLFCVQPMLSAKTLLEQYLNCDGFEEFVFHIETPGKTNQNHFFCGSYQNGNYLLIRSAQQLGGIPDTLKTDFSGLSASIHFDETWWVINTDFLGYDRKIWEDKGLAEEKGNEVERECLGDLCTLRETLLNYGLGHSAWSDLNPDQGTYTNEVTQAIVDYAIAEKTENGMPKVIHAHFTDIEGVVPNSTWKRVVEYTQKEDHSEIPLSISCFVIREGGNEVLKRKIVIDKLIPASHPLSREHFLRPGFEDSDFATNGRPTTYYVRSNQLVGFDSKSNEVIRMEPDDPRLLNEPSEASSRPLRYWISAVFVIVVAFSFFWFLKKYKQM